MEPTYFDAGAHLQLGGKDFEAATFTGNANLAFVVALEKYIAGHAEEH